MVALSGLWLPILVATAVVWIASAIVWTVLPHHTAPLQLPVYRAQKPTIVEMRVRMRTLKLDCLHLLEYWFRPWLRS